MDSRLTLARTLIICGTLINLASIGLLLDSNHLAADDARDHRQQAVLILKNANIDRVELPEFRPTSFGLTWLSLGGGFVMAALGLGVGLTGSRSFAKPAPDSEWGRRSVT